MKKYLNKILIIDGSYMLHRALHSPGLDELKTSTGIKSGGVYGTLRMLQSEIKKFPGYFPIFCWDKGLSKRRTEIYPDYKANRARLTADELIAAGVPSGEDDYLKEYHRQRSDIILILKYLGIPSLLIPGWEGDDLQYLLTKVCEEGIVISDDKDMIQLVAPNIKIRRAMRDELIDWDNSEAMYHHPRFTVCKSIIGDGSDNIPKCAQGLGEKGADDIAVLLDNVAFDDYKSTLEEHINNETIKGRLLTNVKKLLNNWGQFLINYELINLRLVEPPVGFENMVKDLIKLVVGHANIMKVYQILGKYETTTIYPDQIIGLISASSSQVMIDNK